MSDENKTSLSGESKTESEIKKAEAELKLAEAEAKKAEAEAKKAEAEAKKAEAEARKLEAEAKLAEAGVKVDGTKTSAETETAASAPKPAASGSDLTAIPTAASKDEERLCRDDIRPPKMSPARKASEFLRKAVFVVALLVLVASVLFLGKSGYDYFMNYMEYRSLASQYTSKDPNKNPGKDPSNDPGKTDPTGQEPESGDPAPGEPDEIQAILEKYDYQPLEVDFDKLKEINSDVIGWIHIPAEDISYPMVLGSDNDYYLRHTFKKIYNIGGAIFLDYRNAGDLSDRNTIIYGHNQDNGKMFSNLLDLTDAKEAKKCQLMVIYTPEETLYYQVFSVRIRNYMDPVYGVSYTSAELKAYGDNALFESEFNYNAISEFTDYDRIISLVTCCEDQDYRLLVHGYLLNNPEKAAAEKK